MSLSHVRVVVWTTGRFGTVVVPLLVKFFKGFTPALRVRPVAASSVGPGSGCRKASIHTEVDHALDILDGCSFKVLLRRRMVEMR